MNRLTTLKISLLFIMVFLLCFTLFFGINSGFKLILDIDYWVILIIPTILSGVISFQMIHNQIYRLSKQTIILCMLGIAISFMLLPLFISLCMTVEHSLRFSINSIPTVYFKLFRNPIFYMCIALALVLAIPMASIFNKQMQPTQKTRG